MGSEMCIRDRPENVRIGFTAADKKAMGRAANEYEAAQAETQAETEEAA